MINKDMSETHIYNNASHPVFLRLGCLDESKNYTFLSHWHDDLEFVLVTEGEMLYTVNGRNIVLHKGDAVFVNARRLHSSHAPNNRSCQYICLLFHPTILCSSPHIEENYIHPVLKGGADYILLEKDNAEAEKALEIITNSYRIKDEPEFPLLIQQHLFALWAEIYRLSDRRREEPVPQSYHLSALKEMIEFINKHYSEKITLEQIGKAGGFGETSCCRIFKKYTNKTPLNFLIDHRLQKGIELMLTTDMTVTEISIRTGFSSPSYFSEMFRKNYGCSPREYKQNNMKA